MFSHFIGYFGLEILMNPTSQKPDTLWTACNQSHTVGGLVTSPNIKKDSHSCNDSNSFEFFTKIQNDCEQFVRYFQFQVDLVWRQECICSWRYNAARVPFRLSFIHSNESTIILRSLLPSSQTTTTGPQSDDDRINNNFTIGTGPSPDSGTGLVSCQKSMPMRPWWTRPS
jgi:hypothetical protein